MTPPSPTCFLTDEYLRARQSKSILCLPLIKQQQLIGILLLENKLTSHAFTADRVAVLELLAAQAAISLENSRLYGELLRAGAELQLQVGLLQQLPVSAWTLKPDGTPDFVNQVWLEFAGQTLDFVRSHPEAWMTAVHPEDREFAAKSFWEGVQSGQGFAFETRSLRAQDGIYRRHLQQAVVLRDSEGKVLKFVGTTTDIDDQKRAEEALRQAAGGAGPREAGRDNGPTHRLHCPRGQPTYRCPGYECRNRSTLARPSATKFGKGQAVDRPCHQRWQSDR